MLVREVRWASDHQRPNGETPLWEYIPDQAALHGVLARVRDLNLQLISVTSVTSVDSDRQERSGDRGAEG
jgi:hypothetical protein